MTVRQMTVPQFYVTPGFGEALGNEFYYSQAMRLGDRVEISGQGGWTDELSFPEPIEDEIALAFENVERTLNCAGASWTDVVNVMSYHVPLDDSPAIESDVFVVINREFKKRMPERAPIWTAVAVPKLGIDGMRIEIAVTAITAGE